MSEELLFTAKTEMAEVARPLLASQLAIMEQHRAVLLAGAEETAVYETRKAIRRTFTGLKLFRPFFELDVLEPYRQQLKMMMRYLGQARDVTVFRQKLQVYAEESGEKLDCLVAYWAEQQVTVDRALCVYMREALREDFWEEYGRFTHTPGLYTLPHSNPYAPMSAAHHIPVLIYQRLAGVRAYAGLLADAPLARLHMLRIQGKELRYTLQFFAPVLGPEIESVGATLERMQEHLGALQDGAVGLRLLGETVGCETAVAIYRKAKEQEIIQLVATFPAIWVEVNSPAWRQNLAAAIGVL